jgi:hypothetical protein
VPTEPVEAVPEPAEPADAPTAQPADAPAAARERGDPPPTPDPDTQLGLF